VWKESASTFFVGLSLPDFVDVPEINDRFKLALRSRASMKEGKKRR